MVLKANDLGKDYSTDIGIFTAIASLVFEVAEEGLFCLVVPADCGKATLLRCVAGLLEPTRGEAIVDGAAVSSVPSSTTWCRPGHSPLRSPKTTWACPMATTRSNTVKTIVRQNAHADFFGSRGCQDRQRAVSCTQ